jgi:hypothetical protein
MEFFKVPRRKKCLQTALGVVNIDNAGDVTRDHRIGSWVQSYDRDLQR